MDCLHLDVERPVLEMVHVSKRFGATQALDDVSLALQRGEIHALLGENGAGKSTLIKIMTGIQQQDSGEIRIDGAAGPRRLLAGCAAPRRRRHVPGADDLPRSLGRREHLHRPPQPGQDRRPAPDGARGAARSSARLDVRLDVGEPARGLTLAEQQTVEIAKAISLDVRVLIMDEPTASLSAHEVAAALPHRDDSAPAGRGDSLHLPPHGRGLRDRRPRHDPARRPLDLDHAARGADARARRSARMVGREVRGALPPRAARTGRGPARRCAVSAARARSRTSRSSCAPARCSGLPVWSARGAPTSGWRSSGSPRRTAATIDARRQAGHRHQSAPGDAARHRLQHRGPAPARTGHAAVDRRQHLAALAAALPLAGRAGARERRSGRPPRRSGSGSASAPPSVDTPTSSLSGRQSAESRHQQVAGDEPEGADSRRADPRHRRRRQGRGPSA